MDRSRHCDDGRRSRGAIGSLFRRNVPGIDLLASSCGNVQTHQRLTTPDRPDSTLSSVLRLLATIAEETQEEEEEVEEVEIEGARAHDGIGAGLARARQTPPGGGAIERQGAEHTGGHGERRRNRGPGVGESTRTDRVTPVRAASAMKMRVAVPGASLSTRAERENTSAT